MGLKDQKECEAIVDRQTEKAFQEKKAGPAADERPDYLRMLDRQVKERYALLKKMRGDS